MRAAAAAVGTACAFLGGGRGGSNVGGVVGSGSGGSGSKGAWTRLVAGAVALDGGDCGWEGKYGRRLRLSGASDVSVGSSGGPDPCVRAGSRFRGGVQRGLGGEEWQGGRSWSGGDSRGNSAFRALSFRLCGLARAACSRWCSL
eukprot:6208952-Pleurochrysis_carterae.AAC.3